MNTKLEFNQEEIARRARENSETYSAFFDLESQARFKIEDETEVEESYYW